MSLSSMAAKFGTTATGEHHENHQSGSSLEEVEPTRTSTSSTSSGSSSSAVPPAGSSTLVQQLLVTKQSYNFGKANQNQGSSKSTPRPPVSLSSSSTNKSRYNIGSSIDTKSSFNDSGGYKKQKTNHRDHDTPLPQSLYTQRLDSILAQILESIPHDKDQVIR